VIVRFYTVPNVRAARYSGFWALLFIGLLYTTAPAIAVFAKYNLIDTLNGISAEELEESETLGWARSWQQTGLLEFEDKDGDGTFQLTNSTETSEIIIDRDIIVLSTPEVAQLSPIVIALVAAGGLAAALSTASGLLLVISSSVSHDIYYRLINPEASEKSRLLFGRVVIFIAVIFAGLLGIFPPAFVAQVVAFAFGLGAASFFPIILLGIFDKRTNDKGAIAGMIVGLVFTAGYIVGNKYMGMPAWFMGISAEGIGTVGAILNFAVTFGVSRLTEAPPKEIQELVENVRVPRGAIEASVSH
jgi:cation/acetate symporter